MPKHTSAPKTNVKAARAQKRSAEAIQEAVRKMELRAEDAPEFYSVQKVLGNGSFLIRNAWGVEYRGVGGHGGGKAEAARKGVPFQTTPELLWQVANSQRRESELPAAEVAQATLTATLTSAMP